MAIVWREKNPGATDEEIKAFEDKEQLVLPESYKAFLREMDGGCLELGHSAAYVDQRLGKTFVGLLEFYGIRETTFGSLSTVRRNIKDSVADEDFFPDNMLYVVGTNGGHEGIVLLLGTEEVYLWFDYTEEILLASTFGDFLSMIRSSDGDEI